MTAERMPGQLETCLQARRARISHSDCLAVLCGDLPLDRYTRYRKLSLDHTDSIKSLISVLATEQETADLSYVDREDVSSRD